MIEIGAALFASDGFAELDQTRATPAKNHFMVEDMQGGGHESILVPRSGVSGFKVLLWGLFPKSISKRRGHPLRG